MGKIAAGRATHPWTCVQTVKPASSFVQPSFKPIRCVSQGSAAHFLPTVRHTDATYCTKLILDQTEGGKGKCKKLFYFFQSGTDVSAGRVDVQIIPTSPDSYIHWSILSALMVA